ncbi:distal membrane-arm assembly complex protein 1 [Rana temporaria]|uniref:distal membrane-arm assembly complex protein 1 n=1 Tax=Rana temporaria TaxID=8407 RepID=UPI001AACBA46|nr:distal membrane-arm assembly complex protein 1 [Rana temporaria]
MPSTEKAHGNQQKSCSVCGIIGGSGLMAAGGYIYFHARKFVTPGYIPVSAAFQMVFALGVTTFGVATFLKPALELIGTRSSNPIPKR